MASPPSLALARAKLTNLPPPPLDPSIPLDGFTWDGSTQLYHNPGAHYTFDPSTKVFTSTNTRDEYVYDVDAALYRPRYAENDGEPFKELLEPLQQQLSARTEALSSLLGQLTARFTPRKDENGAVTSSWADSVEGAATAPLPSVASIKARVGAAAANTVARVPALRLPLGSPRVNTTAATPFSAASATSASATPASSLASPQQPSSASNSVPLGTKTSGSSNNPGRYSQSWMTSMTTTPMARPTGSGPTTVNGHGSAASNAERPLNSARLGLTGSGNTTTMPPPPPPIIPPTTDRNGTPTNTYAAAPSVNSAPLGRAPGAAGSPRSARPPAPADEFSVNQPPNVPSLALSLSGVGGGGGGAASSRRGPPLSARTQLTDLSDVIYDEDAAPGGYESTRHELEAAREALRVSKGKHARELEAVRKGWTARCDELSTTISKLRAELASSAAAAAVTTSITTSSVAPSPPKSPTSPNAPTSPTKAALQSQLASLTAALAEAQGMAQTAMSNAANDVRTAREGATARASEARQSAAEAARWKAEAEAARQAQADAERELRLMKASKEALSVEAAAFASSAVMEAQGAAAAAAAREAHIESEGIRVVENLEAQLFSLTQQLAALSQAGSPNAHGGDHQRALASAEGRLQLEQQRHQQQLQRLEFENEELRRASKAKSEKINSLKAAMEAAGVSPRSDR